MPAMTKTPDDFLPSTYLAVLSIIANGAEYGYEINNIINDYGYHEWVELRFSSVYKALTELEKREFIEGKKTDDTLQPSKKTYRLTRRGREVLRKQIFKCLSDPPRPKTIFDLGLSAMNLLSKDEALAALKTYRKNLESSLNFLESTARNFDNLERLKAEEPSARVGKITVAEFDNSSNIGVVKALFARPAASVGGQLDWLNSFIADVELGDGFTFRRPRGE